MIPRSDITDLDRAKFLEKLWEASRSHDGILLFGWAADFVASYKKAYRNWQWFTDGRRVATDELRIKFGNEPEIAMPFPLANSSPADHPAADPGCCMFLIRDEGRQQPCNAPAVCQRKSGFLYCEMHRDAVQADLKRRTGKVLALYPFTPI